MKNVVSNLTAPFNFLLLCIVGINGFLSLFQLMLIELGFQHLHGPCFVLVLGPFVLTLHHNIGRQVGNSNR